jgi:multidrug transporter EmrE-like cation transporter
VSSLAPQVLLAVLIGALLHASWNALVKSSTDKTLDTALIQVLCSLFALPVCWYVGLPDPQVWPYIGTSLLVHVAYYFALAGAYRHGDLGLAYPLMRGTAPVLVALSSFVVLGEVLMMRTCCVVRSTTQVGSAVGPLLDWMAVERLGEGIPYSLAWSTCLLRLRRLA